MTAVIGIGVGVLLVLAVAGAIWLPGALTYFAVRRSKPEGTVFLAVRDKSMPALGDEFGATEPAVHPHLYSTVVVTGDGVTVWARNGVPRPILRIPAERMSAIRMDYAPFATVTPIRFLTIEIEEAEPLSLVPYGRTGLLPLPRRRLEDLQRELGRGLGVPVVAL